MEFTFELLDIATVLDSRDDRGVSTGTSDASGFEGLDQRRFGKTSGRRGKMLRWVNSDGPDGLILFDCRQELIAISNGQARNLHKTIENKFSTGGLEQNPALISFSSDVNTGYVPLSRGHLAGDKPSPDHIV